MMCLTYSPILGGEPLSHEPQIAVVPLDTENIFCSRDAPLFKESPEIGCLTGKPQQQITGRWRGRVDTDFIWSEQDYENLAAFGDLSDVVGLRRARIGVEGELASWGRYIAEIDLASGEVVLRDLFVGFHRAEELHEIRVGHYREPFSLEGSTSATSFAFMERAPINTLDPARNWGLAWFGWNEHEDSTFAIGLFQSASGPSDLQGGDGDDTAATARWTVLPYEEGDRLVHLGIALSSRLPNNGIVLINQQPRSPLLELGDSSSTPFLPTLRIPADFQQLFNVQGAIQNGPLILQAEWYGSWIDQTGGSPVFLHGSYVDASCFLNGGRRVYSKQQGAFGAVQVDHPVLRHFSSKSSQESRGWGAWEATARLAYLDFNDGNLPSGPIPGQSTGVELVQATFGVNWYLADRLRILFNYSLASPQNPTSDEGVANIFGMRLGAFW
jgi:phosphate-selective porin OprO/OprP